MTSPELRIRIWMLSKRNASMIIGISMGQEMCLIIGQVSLSLHDWKKNTQTDICGSVGLIKRQETSRPHHLWSELWTKLGRNAKLREKHEWATEKPNGEDLLRNGVKKPWNVPSLIATQLIKSNMIMS